MGICICVRKRERERKRERIQTLRTFTKLTAPEIPAFCLAPNSSFPKAFFMAASKNPCNDVSGQRILEDNLGADVVMNAADWGTVTPIVINSRQNKVFMFIIMYYPLSLLLRWLYGYCEIAVDFLTGEWRVVVVVVVAVAAVGVSCYCCWLLESWYYCVQRVSVNSLVSCFCC